MTNEQKRAIARICEDFGFDDLKELREYFKDNYCDPLYLDLWSKTEKELYNEIAKLII